MTVPFKYIILSPVAQLTNAVGPIINKLITNCFRSKVHVTKMIMLNHPGENLPMWSLRVMLKPGLMRAVFVKNEQFLGKMHLNASSFCEE